MLLLVSMGTSLGGAEGKSAWFYLAFTGITKPSVLISKGFGSLGQRDLSSRGLIRGCRTIYLSGVTRRGQE